MKKLFPFSVSHFNTKKMQLIIIFILCVLQSPYRMSASTEGGGCHFSHHNHDKDILAIDATGRLYNINIEGGLIGSLISSYQLIATGLSGNNALATNTNKNLVYYGRAQKMYYYDPATGTEGVLIDMQSQIWEYMTILNGGAAYDANTNCLYVGIGNGPGSDFRTGWFGLIWGVKSQGDVYKIQLTANGKSTTSITPMNVKFGSGLPFPFSMLPPTVFPYTVLDNFGDLEVGDDGYLYGVTGTLDVGESTVLWKIPLNGPSSGSKPSIINTLPNQLFGMLTLDVPSIWYCVTPMSITCNREGEYYAGYLLPGASLLFEFDKTNGNQNGIWTASAMVPALGFENIILPELGFTDFAKGLCCDGDGDSVCYSDDCDDNDPSIPANPGTPCDDGNIYTANDVIQADGCTCMGIPSGSGNRLVDEGIAIHLYPNPCVNDVNIQFTASENAGSTTIQIVDMLGQVVREMTKQPNQGINQWSIPIQNLSEGAYFAVIRTNDTVSREIKFLKLEQGY